MGEKCIVMLNGRVVLAMNMEELKNLLLKTIEKKKLLLIAG